MNIGMFFAISSLNFQTEDKFAEMTVNKENFVPTIGDRFETRRPPDSDLLKGDGSFSAETQHCRDFQPVTGERCEIQRPTTSDLWKVKIGTLIGFK
jgi:hypothetical protein